MPMSSASRRLLSRAVVPALVLLGLVACARTSDVDPDKTAQAVVERFLVARQDRNLDATMACFAEWPEMRSSLGVGWSGPEAVRAIMAYRMSDSYTVRDLRAVGNRVIWTEHVHRISSGWYPGMRSRY